MSSNNTAVAVLNPKPLDIEAIYERYVSTYATCDVEKIKMLHTENSKFWLHSAGAKPVLGRDAIAETFAESSSNGREPDSRSIVPYSGSDTGRSIGR